MWPEPCRFIALAQPQPVICHCAHLNESKINKYKYSKKQSHNAQVCWPLANDEMACRVLFFSRPTHNRQQVLRVAFLESPKRNSYPCLQLVFIYTYRCVYVYSYVLYLRAIKPGGYRLSLLLASQVIPPSEASNYSNWASLIALYRTTSNKCSPTGWKHSSSVESSNVTKLTRHSHFYRVREPSIGLLVDQLS